MGIGFTFTVTATAADAEAAKALARQNGCFKCHGTDKAKDGSSFKSIAAKYKGDADAVSQADQPPDVGRDVQVP